MSYGTLHPDHCRELQEILSQYHEVVFGCNGASGVATPWPHWHSNFVGASSLLRLLCAVDMAAAMVTSVQGCRGGCLEGLGGEPPPPPPPLRRPRRMRK